MLKFNFLIFDLNPNRDLVEEISTGKLLKYFGPLTKKEFSQAEELYDLIGIIFWVVDLKE